LQPSSSPSVNPSSQPFVTFWAPIILAHSESRFGDILQPTKLDPGRVPFTASPFFNFYANFGAKLKVIIFAFKLAIILS